MKAIVLTKAGGVENLIMQEVAQPKIKENEVLVKVNAIGLNPADVKPKYVDEMLNMFFGTERPIILGWDIAGTISEVGSEVSNFKVGDKVFGMVNFPGVGNAYAEYVAAPADHLALMPQGASYEESVASTLAALTALQILEGRVKKDDKVLIHGGSGGVGHFAVQIAKSLGAYVYTTASTKNGDFVKSLGADEHIDYNKVKYEEVLSDIDFVLDIFGPESAETSIKVLKKGGTIYSTAIMEVPESLANKAKEAGVNVSGLLVKSSAKDMNTIKKMMEEGTLKPTIDKVFPFEDMRDAHTAVEKGGLVGKVVVAL
ncbi:NADP-dependent oxidoreductase [Saccharicrinis aurantiacus]|uniref:NADP-dependent oxidoreductase n=1 Tax=Saccharicrinis aurantiacus TaxID=1849719 RepID=UPI0024935C7D|nr:NADP-dependent oxidoreductase [Saccharicrinis aurantiacus]